MRQGEVKHNKENQECRVVIVYTDTNKNELDNLYQGKVTTPWESDCSNNKFVKEKTPEKLSTMKLSKRKKSVWSFTNLMNCTSIANANFTLEAKSDVGKKN